MAPKLSMIQKIKTIAYSNDRNSIYLKMTKWERILEMNPSSLFFFFFFRKEEWLSKVTELSNERDTMGPGCPLPLPPACLPLQQAPKLPDIACGKWPGWMGLFSLSSRLCPKKGFSSQQKTKRRFRTPQLRTSWGGDCCSEHEATWTPLTLSLPSQPHCSQRRGSTDTLPVLVISYEGRQKRGRRLSQLFYHPDSSDYTRKH